VNIISRGRFLKWHMIEYYLKWLFLSLSHFDMFSNLQGCNIGLFYSRKDQSTLLEIKKLFFLLEEVGIVNRFYTFQCLSFCCSVILDSLQCHCSEGKAVIRNIWSLDLFSSLEKSCALRIWQIFVIILGFCAASCHILYLMLLLFLVSSLYILHLFLVLYMVLSVTSYICS